MVIVIVIIVLFIINNIKNMIALMLLIMKTHVSYYHDYWSLQLQELQGLELQGLQGLQEEGWADPQGLQGLLACPHSQSGRAARGRGQNIPWGLVNQGRPMRWECPGHCEGRTLA